MSKTFLQPRGLTLTQSAKYLGVAPDTLKKMIHLGHVAEPVEFPGLSRKLFDRRELDRVFEKRGRSTSDAA